jgi:hypothetical protein
MVLIRGINHNPAPYTDRDVLRIATALQVINPAEAIAAEVVVATLLRQIFPSLPPELTQGDRLLLHSAEMVSILDDLQRRLLSDENFGNALDPLKRLPIGADAVRDINSLQAQMPRSNQHQPSYRGKGRR